MSDMVPYTYFRASGKYYTTIMGVAVPPTPAQIEHPYLWELNANNPNFIKDITCTIFIAGTLPIYIRAVANEDADRFRRQNRIDSITLLEDKIIELQRHVHDLQSRNSELYAENQNIKSGGSAGDYEYEVPLLIGTLRIVSSEPLSEVRKPEPQEPVVDSEPPA